MIELARGGKCQRNVTKSSFVCLVLLYLDDEDTSCVIIRSHGRNSSWRVGSV
jgi:hypothetical protein